MLPVADTVYDFRTLLREDPFNYETGAGVTTANVVLIKQVYDDDIATIDITSSLATDSPLFASYSTSTRQLDITGLTEASNRTLTVSYDADALTGNSAISTLMGWIPYIWLLSIIVFPLAALFAIFTGRV